MPSLRDHASPSRTPFFTFGRSSSSCPKTVRRRTHNAVLIFTFFLITLFVICVYRPVILTALRPDFKFTKLTLISHTTTSAHSSPDHVRSPLAASDVTNTNKHPSPHITVVNSPLQSEQKLSNPVTPATIPTHPLPHQPHHVHIVGVDPAEPMVWKFNSRAYHVTSAICIRPSTQTSLPHFYSAADLTSTQCTLESPSLQPVRSTFDYDCQKAMHEYTLCAHGKYRSTKYPACPKLGRLSDLSSRDNATAHWIPDLAIVVPAYPFLENIFHFSFVAGAVSHISTQLPHLLRRYRNLPESYNGPPRVTIVYRHEAPPKLGQWQVDLMDILVRRRLQREGRVEVSQVVLSEDPLGGSIDGDFNSNSLTCAKSAVLLGDRGDINLWPFANGTAVSLDGNVVSAESVAFRRAMYDEVGITTRLPPLVQGGAIMPSTAKVDLPPLVLGYARRDSMPDPVNEAFVRKTTRRFNDADDAWFVGMLREECHRHGVQYKEFKLRGNESFADQVRLFEGIGFVVGIHGANLVNAIFMRPFGALLEVLPGGLGIECYVAGANTGLAYFLHNAEKATAEETFCPKWDKICWKLFRNRRVKIESQQDRVGVRGQVRAGLAHVKRLHNKYSDGVPVKLNREQGQFEIVE